MKEDDFLTDCNGKNKLSKNMIRAVILEGEFIVAWLFVCRYLLQMRITKEFHQKMMLFQASNKYSILMTGRGLGKSYLLNTSYVITLILRDLNIRILVLTQNNNQSSAFVGIVQGFFNKGTVICEMFGDLKGDLWTDSKFNVKRDGIQKDRTLSAASLGASGNIISFHFDVLIMDDVVGEENASSKHQRDKMLNFMYNTVFPTIMEDRGYGYMHGIGTHYHPADFWSTMEDGNRFNILKIKSLQTIDGVEKSVCEEQISTEKLIFERNNLPSINFNMQYQQEVPKDVGGIFSRKWIEYFSKYSVRNDVAYVTRVNENSGIKEEEEVEVYIGVDLAISQKTTADSFVIAVIGRGKETGNTYLLDMYRSKLSFKKQMDKIKFYYSKWYMALRVGIESVAYQSALADTLIEDTDIPIKKVNTIKDKVTRMTKFSGQWENGKVFMYNHIDVLHILESELLAFPEAEHDDTIDAFTIAWEVSNDNVVRKNKVRTAGSASMLGF